jgi:uncharacterized protein YjbJ (UPF0337 family)
MSKLGRQGGAQKTVGAAKDAIGKVTGDNKLRAEGMVDKAVGGAKQAIGKAKDALHKASK